MEAEHIGKPQPSLETPRFSLVIPFYNEEANAGWVLESIIEALDQDGLSFELIAVDNGSVDGTGQEIASVGKKDLRIVPLRIDRNQGYGFGILSGLARARGSVLGYTWGDGQVGGADLLKIFRAMDQTGADLAKANRVKREDGAWRGFQSRCYRGLFSLLFGRGIRDPNGCPKIFTRSTLERLAPRSKDWLLDPEIMVKAQRLNLRITEVPVLFARRKGGISKVNLLTSLSFASRFILMRFGWGL